MNTQTFSMGVFEWWFGVVEDRKDPEKLGRYRVRIVGYHTKEKGDIPTEDLPWAMVIQPITSAAISGIGMTPTGILEGTWVMGFFRDGRNAQEPVILGTLAGRPKDGPSGEGFSDPNSKYPKFVSESDVNRLGRNEKIEETIVQKKKDDRDLKNKEALSTTTWDQPEIPYGAEYPFNHVRESESGHIEEFDDTEDNERYHLYHKAGGFLEIDKDGTEVKRIKKDKYEIIMGDEFVHIKGKVQVRIEGDASILVEGNTKTETRGNHEEYVYGDYKLLVGGQMIIRSKSHIYHDAPSIDLNKPGPELKFVTAP